MFRHACRLVLTGVLTVMVSLGFAGLNHFDVYAADVTYTDFLSGTSSTTAPTNPLAMFYFEDTARNYPIGYDSSLDSTVSSVYYIPGSTASSVAGKDTTNKVAWVVKDKKLYVFSTSGHLGYLGVTDAGVSASEAASVSQSETFDVPMKDISIMYGDIEGKNYGVEKPYMGDEKTYGKGDFYTYKAPTADKYTVNAESRGALSGMNYSYTTFYRAFTPPWAAGLGVSTLGTLTEVHLGEDIELRGNVSFLFNGHGSNNLSVSLPTSDYGALNTVYFGCDTSDVTFAAGLFARCHNLQRINVQGEADFQKLQNSAMMFFGDALLENGSGSLIDNMDLSSGTLKNTSYMFAGCAKITVPDIHDYDMSNVTKALGMFYGAQNARLTFTDNSSKAYVGDWSLGNLVNGMYMFEGRPFPVTKSSDTSTTDVIYKDPNPGYGTLSGSETGAVVSGMVRLDQWENQTPLNSLVLAQYMFAQNNSISGAVFGSSYSSLKDISEMFVRCDSLSALTMKNTSMPELLYAQYTFMCDGTGGTADLSGLNTPKLENIAYMFYKSGFTSVQWTGSTLSSLKDATAAFASNRNLTTLMIDSRLSTLQRASFMCFNDERLSSCNVKDWGMSTVSDASFMFMGDKALTVLDTSNWTIGSVNCNMENFAYGAGVGMIDLHSAGSNITNIAFAFANNDSLTDFVPPSSMRGVTNAFGAFSKDPSLINVGLTTSAATDMRGLFAGDSSLAGGSAVNVAPFITDSAKYGSFMFKDCTSLSNVNLADASTGGMTYMEGMFDGCNTLADVVVGSKFTPAFALDTGCMFRNCNLTDASGKNIVTAMADSDSVTDMYAMFEGNRNLSVLDLSPMNFSAAKDLSRFAWGCDKLGVITDLQVRSVPGSGLPKITIPPSFTTAVTGADNGKNIFYVDKNVGGVKLNDKDSSDDVYTYLNVASASMPEYLESYSWTGDNRLFTMVLTQTIDGEEASTHIYTDKETKVTLAVDGMTTLTFNDAPDTLVFDWTAKDSKKKETALAEKDGDYDAPKSTYGKDVWQITAIAYPDSLTSAWKSGILAGSTADFWLGAKVKRITAEYKGKSVGVGKEYNKDDVEVKVEFDNGETAVIPSSKWEASGLVVNKKGDNTFTATYVTDSGETLTADYIVPGARVIGSIETVYSGPAVLVGENYSKQYLTTTAYYADDKDKKEGFVVTPTAYSGTKVTAIGNNRFKSFYYVEAQDETFSSEFVVKGYKTVARIEAEYQGPKIKVGERYSKGDVKVTVYYADGTSARTTNFSTDSMVVSYEGANSFIATHTDGQGNSYTAGFSVPGYKEGGSGDTSDNNKDDGGRYATLSDVYGGPASYGTGPAYTPLGGVYAAAGMVQTGRTGKVVLYSIALAVVIIVFIIVVIRKKRDDKV